MKLGLLKSWLVVLLPRGYPTQQSDHTPRFGPEIKNKSSMQRWRAEEEQMRDNPEGDLDPVVDVHKAA